MPEALMERNEPLHTVVSDITGVTVMRIIRAIAAGERKPNTLAEMRDIRCHASVEKISAAFSGNWPDEHVFALCQSLALYDFYQTKILECDRKLEIALKALERSEEHTSELQSLMRISYAVFCLKQKIKKQTKTHNKNN